MDLSIVIVNWNTVDMTRDCLASIYENTFGISYEVIVVDNASEDGSGEMISKEFSQAKLIQNSENFGFAKANNQGFQIAKGRHILLLNSDTLVHGDVIARSVQWLDAHPDAAAMGCRVLNGDGSVQRTCSMYPSLLNQLLLSSGLWKLSWPKFLGRGQMVHWSRDDERDVEVISGCYLLVRRRVIDEVGMLDDSFFFFGEETDWCLRMRLAGWRLVFSPVGEITHFGSVSAKKLNHKRDILLTEAKVHLHRKHSGVLAASVIWLNALLFNGSRALFWSIYSLFRKEARNRANHFCQVTLNLGDAWRSKRA